VISEPFDKVSLVVVVGSVSVGSGLTDGSEELDGVSVSVIVSIGKPDLLASFLDPSSCLHEQIVIGIPINRLSINNSGRNFFIVRPSYISHSKKIIAHPFPCCDMMERVDKAGYLGGYYEKSTGTCSLSGINHSSIRMCEKATPGYHIF
jgi:hypothetical protein